VLPITLVHRVGLRARLWRGAALLVVIGLTISRAYGQSPDPAIQAVAAFDNRTHDYVVMHRRLEGQIRTIQLGTPVGEINRIIHELAAAIRAERGDARPGEFFTPPLVHLLRARISDALLAHHYTADDVRAAGRVDGVDYRRVRLQVNDTFPWILAVGMFPCLVEALPALPPELQYRIVGDDLVLIDVHASLVVDILPHALIDRTTR
jgi:hypothetical protein